MIHRLCSARSPALCGLLVLVSLIASDAAELFIGDQLIAAAGIPIGVPPGHHDYDAMYQVDSAAWSRAHEQSKMSDAEFLVAEGYDIELQDSRERFGPPAP